VLLGLEDQDGGALSERHPGPALPVGSTGALVDRAQRVEPGVGDLTERIRSPGDRDRHLAVLQVAEGRLERQRGGGAGGGDGRYASGDPEPARHRVAGAVQLLGG
jgi:hypothetical protein